MLRACGTDAAHGGEERAQNTFSVHLHLVSSPGLTGRSSNHRILVEAESSPASTARGLLDCPVKPGNDSHGIIGNEILTDRGVGRNKRSALRHLRAPRRNKAIAPYGLSISASHAKMHRGKFSPIIEYSIPQGTIVRLAVTVFTLHAGKVENEHVVLIGRVSRP
jgi:hypothetical protein